MAAFVWPFDLLDTVVGALGALFVLRGLRRGALRQLFGAGGYVGGFLGCLAVSGDAARLVSSPILKLILVVVMALVGGWLGSRLGEMIGGRLGQAVRSSPLGLLDRLVGAAWSLGLLLGGVWLVASILSYLPSRPLSTQLRRSVIVSSLESALPPFSSVVGDLRRIGGGSLITQAFTEAVPSLVSPATQATAAQVRIAEQADSVSLAKVEGVSCGVIQEGSGFVVAPHLLLTNAHVVAGVRRPELVEPDGEVVGAEVVYFNPAYDLALLYAPRLDAPPLELDRQLVSGPVPAVVLGYPYGGPLSGVRAVVLGSLDAVGRNIYGKGMILRDVYEVEARVDPGNSGGPVVGPGGQVLGVVYSRSISRPDVGFALASPGVLARIIARGADLHPVSTGRCLAG